MAGFRFGEFEVDLGTYSLRRGGEVVPLQPRVFDLLCYLIEHQGRVVPKAELFDRFWPSEDVSEAVLSWSVSHIRAALGQGRGAGGFIETVHRRGYRFTAEVANAARASPASPKPNEPARGATLVGRERVMAELVERLRGAAAGRGTLCVLSGGPGIGKTRCALELLGRAPELGLREVVARCPQEPDTPPLWPILNALGRLGRDEPELAQRARALLESAATAADGTDHTRSEGLRFARIEQAASLLRELARRRPTLLVLDDLQWADATTLRLLAYLTPELRDLPLCVVATSRDRDHEPADGPAEALLQVVKHAHTIPLSKLDQDQVAELFFALAERRPSVELAAAVRRASEGVPLFVEEVVRTLVSEHGREALDALRPDAVRVPQLARDLLRQRLEMLPEGTLSVLSRAAVLGERFDLSLLSALAGLEAEALLGQLEPARAAGHLEADAPHEYRFAHSLYHTVLYEGLPAAQRVALHAQVAALLAQRPDAEQRKAEIARHAFLSLPVSQPREVLERARAAATQALRAFAFEDAARYFAWALEAEASAGAAEPRVRGELLRSLASAQRAAGRTHDALESSVRLIELAQQHDLHDLLIAATRLRRPTVAMASLPDALARSALEGVLKQAAASAPIRINALAQLALLPPYEPDLARSKAVSLEAVALAEAQPGHELLLEALRARLFSLSGPDDVDELLGVATRMLTTPSGVTWQSGDARTARFTAFLLAGRIADADRVLDEMASAIPGPHWGEANFYCERLRAQRAFLDGRFDESEARWQAAFDEAVRAGVSYAELFRGAHTLHLAVERRGPAALAQLVRALGGRPGMTLANRAGLARIAAYAGDLDLVREQLATLGDPSTYPRDANYLHLLASLAVCVARARDLVRAEQLLTLLSPHAALNTPDALGYYLGSVAYFLGLLSEVLGHDARAAEHYEHALERNLAMGYRAGVVRTLLAHAALEQRLGRAARARDLLERARARARELGMAGALADAERALGPG